MKPMAAALAALLLSGCATTKYVPVSTPRTPPRPPIECDKRQDPKFPRVQMPVGGGVLPPDQAAKWALKSRQWGQEIARRRQVCAVYTNAMQKWK